MSSTYSSNLRVELIGSGDQAGTWGTTTDNNFAYIFDTAIAGAATVTITTTPQALTAINGATSTAANNQAVYATLKLVSAPSAFTLYAPPAAKQYIIWNATSYTATIGNATALGGTTATGGTTITLAAGEKSIVWSDASNFYKLDTGTVNSVAMTVPTFLSVAGSPITSSGTLAVTLSGSALPVANGGTGAVTLTSGSLLKGAGTSAIAAASASDITTAIGTSAVTNATNASNLLTTNFTVQESGGKLIIKYGATTILSIDSSGNVIATGAFSAGGTP